jgi:hypothetical protein
VALSPPLLAPPDELSPPLLDPPDELAPDELPGSGSGAEVGSWVIVFAFEPVSSPPVWHARTRSEETERPRMRWKEST